MNKYITLFTYILWATKNFFIIDNQIVDCFHRKSPLIFRRILPNRPNFFNICSMKTTKPPFMSSPPPEFRHEEFKGIWPIPWTKSDTESSSEFACVIKITDRHRAQQK